MNLIKNIFSFIISPQSSCSCGSHSSGCGSQCSSGPQKTEPGHNVNANDKDRGSSKTT